MRDCQGRLDKQNSKSLMLDNLEYENISIAVRRHNIRGSFQD